MPFPTERHNLLEHFIAHFPWMDKISSHITHMYSHKPIKLWYRFIVCLSFKRKKILLWLPPFHDLLFSSKMTGGVNIFTANLIDSSRYSMPLTVTKNKIGVMNDEHPRSLLSWVLCNYFTLLSLLFKTPSKGLSVPCHPWMNSCADQWKILCYCWRVWDT